MKRFLFVLTTFFFLFGAVLSYRADGKKPPQDSTYHALIIGNNQYKHLPKLKTGRNDAIEVEKLLKDKFHFKTELLLDATRTDILDRINGLRKRLRKEDNLLIYYAGHGDYKKEAEKAYWLPVDAQRDNNTNWIIVDDITSNIKMIASRHILVISDSCYSGTLAREAITELLTGEREEYLKKMVGRPSRTLMASGGNEPVSDSGGGNNSVFADALLKSLKETGKDAFTAQEIFPRIKEIVAGRSDQIPEYCNIRNSGHDGGDFVFVLPKQIAGLKIQEREEKDKFSIDDLEKKDKADRATWNTKLKNMKTAFEKAEQFEKKKVSSDLKIAAWQRFLDAYQEKNPYSDEDTRLRDKAGERINHWQSEKKALEEAWAQSEAKKKEAEEKKKQAEEEKRQEAERLKEEKEQKRLEAKQKQEEERQRLEEEKQRTEEEKADGAAWAGKMKKMKTAFKKTEAYEKKKVTLDKKIEAWMSFLDSYQEKNPYSEEDTKLREKAEERIAYWQNKKDALEEKKAKKEEPVAQKEKPEPPLWAPKPPPPPPPKPTPPSTYTDPVTGTEMILVKGGCYQMGDTFGDGDSDEKPVHEVCVDDFFLGKYEVTQGQWKAIMGDNPSHFKYGDNYPVETISYYDVQEFIRKLNERSDKKYRLPTEGEWEYAARSGGKKEEYGTGNEYEVWYDKNSGRQTHHVGQKSANGLGLYDMSGNVWEWCQDTYNPNAYLQHSRNNPLYTGSNAYRVKRGGAWNGGLWSLRAAGRGRGTLSEGDYSLGFRLVMGIDEKWKQTNEQNRQKQEEERQRLEEEKKAKAAASAPSFYTDPITGMEFVMIPAGSFTMGSPENEPGRQDKDEREGPQHRVEITQPFYLGKHEVTVGQFRKFVQDTGYKTEAEIGGGAYTFIEGKWEKKEGTYWDNPGFSQTDRHPVTCISWNDAQAFIRWLNRKFSRTYRLPTEAEWEYAARAETTTSRFWGDDPDQACKYANGSDQTIDHVNKKKWNSPRHECEDGYFFTAPVGNYSPNAFGLYDMLGNVWEWCEDWFDMDYYKISRKQNPTGPSYGNFRVVRGGAWVIAPRGVRAANRIAESPVNRYSNLGSRLAIGIDEKWIQADTQKPQEVVRAKEERERQRLEEEKKAKAAASAPFSYTDSVTGMEFVLIRGGLSDGGHLW